MASVGGLGMSALLPPTVEFVLRERLHKIETPSELLKAVSRGGFFKDLRAQAEYSSDSWGYDPDARRDGSFHLMLSESLNPLSPIGKCTTLRCRPSRASSYGRTLSLYADVTIISDVVTGYVME